MDFFGHSQDQQQDNNEASVQAEIEQNQLEAGQKRQQIQDEQIRILHASRGTDWQGDTLNSFQNKQKGVSQAGTVGESASKLARETIKGIGNKNAEIWNEIK